MSRAVSNLLIVLVMATTATAVLAFSSNTADVEAPGSSSIDTELAATQLEPAQTDDSTSQTSEPPADDTDAADDTSDTAPVNPDRAGRVEAPEVLGAVESAQEVEEAEISQTQETLPETGPVEIAQALIIATAIIATGGLARNAGRDHEDGLLTVLP